MTDKELYDKQGYVRMRSAILSREVYIVKHMDVSVPDMTLLRFGEEEVAYLKKLKKQNHLDDEQLRVLTMAKEEFGGTIIDANAKDASKSKRKRAATRQVPRQNTVYTEPKSWTIKSKGRSTV